MINILIIFALLFPIWSVNAASFSNGTPVFYQNGSVVTSVVCGDTYSFDVVGYSNKDVWIDMTKDDKKVFDGIMSVPIQPYTSVCNSETSDAGKYGVTHYSIENDTKGTGIAGSVFTVQSKSTEDLLVFNSRAPGILSVKLPLSDTKADILFYFLRKYNPDMDIIITVPTDSWLKANNLISSFTSSGGPLRPSLVVGVGVKGLDAFYDVATNSRFYGAAFLPILKDFNKDRDYTMGSLLHEIGHSWSVYMAPALLGSPHWSVFVDNSYSLMGGGMKMTDNNNSTFKIEWKEKRSEQVFNDFDLYAMGLLPPENVRPILAISPISGISLEELRKEITNTASFMVGNIKAQKNKDITINDVISIEGRRNQVPGFTNNNFTNNLRVSFVIVQGPDGTEQELKDALDNVKDTASLFPAEWSRATRGLSGATVFEPVKKATPTVSYFASSLAESKSAELVEDVFESQIHEHYSPSQNTTSATTVPPTTTQPTIFTPIIDQLRQIISRLTAIKNELVDLLRRRALQL